MADEKSTSLKDLAKAYLEKFGSAAKKEIETMSQDPMQRMIRKELTPTEAAKLSAEQMSTGYKKTTEAPFSALRSAVSEAQAGRVPVPQTLDASKAPAWSDIAQNAGVQNPNALAAIQTVGDIVGDNINMAPGAKGAVVASRVMPGRLAQEASLAPGQKIVQKLGADIGALKLDEIFKKADEHTLKKLMDAGHITPEQAAAISLERVKRGFSEGGMVQGYADGGEVQTSTPQQDAQVQYELEKMAQAAAQIPEAEQQVEQAGLQSHGTLAPEVQAGMMARAQDKLSATQTAADPTARQEAQDTLGAISRAAMQGVPSNNTSVDVPPGSGAFPTQYGQGTVLAPTPSLSPEQAVAANAAQEELNAQADVNARNAVAEVENKKRVEKEVAVQKRIQNTDEKVVQDQVKDGLLAPSSNWMGTLGKSIAIMMGALGQGYSGAKNNAVVDFLEKQVEQEIARRKYDNEHALALQKAAIDTAMLKLHEQEVKTDSEYKRGLIKVQQDELASKLGIIKQQQDVLARASKEGGFDVTELNTLDEKTRERLVRTPNGKFVPVARMEDAKRLTQELSDSDDAKKGLQRLVQINEEVGNNPVDKLLNRTLRAEAATIQQALKGKLRLDIFGPGVMTDTEQKLADQIIRNPMAVMTLSSANKTSLETLMRKLNHSERIKLRRAGADVPDSQNERVLRQFMQKNKGIKESDAMSILMNTVNPKTGTTYWQDE